MLKNKKGQILSQTLFMGWRLLLIAIIILAISFNVGKAFTAKQDVRQVEASLLSQKVAECLATNGIFDANKKLSDCFVLEENEYFVKVTAKSFDPEFSYGQDMGSPSIKINCELADKGSKGNDPVCLKTKQYVLIKNRDQHTLATGTLDIFVGINKIGENQLL